MKRIAILGSTGSIGTQALELAASMPDDLEVVALAARRSTRLLAEQARRFRPRLVALADESGADGLRQALAGLDGVQVVTGEAGVEAAALCEGVDTVLAAMVGAAGTPHVLAALRAGKDVALANKEALVVAGALMVEEARRSGALLVPVDSEHSALHQCLRAGERGEVERLILTASGGPFRNLSQAELDRVTPREALRHPTWKMGDKITIDSATLMNKGLEVIEAHWLFGLPAERIEVVVHPQSLVHSLVEFRDGSLVAQISATDMTLPIQYALTYPERLPARGPRLDLAAMGRLEFHAPDPERFPSLRLAYRVLRMGGGAPAVLNAANEVAVEAFLRERLPFPGIIRTVEAVLDEIGPGREPGGLEDLLELDRRAREAASRAIAGV